MTDVKICGITEEKALKSAVKAGARFIGLVFYPPSPRHVTLENAALLAQAAKDRCEIVGLFVNPTDTLLKETIAAVPLTMLQLHGDETVDRVSAIKKQFPLPVIKALRIKTAEDISAAKKYEETADWLLFDSSPKTLENRLFGGSGESFDWTLLKDFRSKKPWMLAGGLSISNISDALNILSPDAVDVSSGVEDSPGHKDPARIRAFIEAVQAA